MSEKTNGRLIQSKTALANLGDLAAKHMVMQVGPSIRGVQSRPGDTSADDVSKACLAGVWDPTMDNSGDKVPYDTDRNADEQVEQPGGIHPLLEANIPKNMPWGEQNIPHDWCLGVNGHIKTEKTIQCDTLRVNKIIGGDSIGNIETDLINERSNRIFQDNELSTRIVNEESSRTYEDNDLSGRIDDEESSRTYGDNDLSGRIDDEESSRLAGVLWVSSKIDDEESSRTYGDNELSTRIVDGDNELSTRIINEASIRTYEDNELSTRIVNEASTRELGDQDLQTQIENLTTTVVPEGTNQYFTDGRAQNACNVTPGDKSWPTSGSPYEFKGLSSHVKVDTVGQLDEEYNLVMHKGNSDKNKVKADSNFTYNPAGDGNNAGLLSLENGTFKVKNLEVLGNFFAGQNASEIHIESENVKIQDKCINLGHVNDVTNDQESIDTTVDAWKQEGGCLRTGSYSFKDSTDVVMIPRAPVLKFEENSIIMECDTGPCNVTINGSVSAKHCLELFSGDDKLASTSRAFLKYYAAGDVNTEGIRLEQPEVTIEYKNESSNERQVLANFNTGKDNTQIPTFTRYHAYEKYAHVVINKKHFVDENGSVDQCMVHFVFFEANDPLVLSTRAVDLTSKASQWGNPIQLGGAQYRRPGAVYMRTLTIDSDQNIPGVDTITINMVFSNGEGDVPDNTFIDHDEYSMLIVAENKAGYWSRIASENFLYGGEAPGGTRD